MIRSIFASVLFTLVGIFFGCLVLELGMRAFATLRQPTPTWNDRPVFYFASPEKSIQDYAYPKKKPAGTYRIAVVGDSFSFAPYMQFTDSFSKQLERMLNLAGKVEVINFGVPAYSTSHEVAAVEDALSYNPDLILLQITLNDPELKPYRPTGIRQDLPDRFGAFSPKGIAQYSVLARFILERLHNSQTYREYTNYFLDLFQNPRSRKVFKNSLAQIAQLAKTKNVPLVAVTFPLFGLPLALPAYPFIPIHRAVASDLSELGVPNFDLYHLYAPFPLDRMQVIPGVDRHPNEIAHRMAAEAIYLWLSEEKRLPAHLLIQKVFKTRVGTTNQPELSAESLTAEYKRLTAPLPESTLLPESITAQ